MMKSLKQFVQRAKHERDETDRLVQQQTDTIYKERNNLCVVLNLMLNLQEGRNI